MTETTFSLIPFPDSKIPNIKISGTVGRAKNLIAIHYSMTGNIDQVLLPPASALPERKHDLWKATCFEFFLAIPDVPQYWEFNMSPSGNWQIYRMDAYRRVGFREETLFQQLPFSFQTEPDCILLEATVDLSLILKIESEIQAGITGVIQSKDGNETYWALIHPGPQADFHRRESFIITLSA